MKRIFFIAILLIADHLSDNPPPLFSQEVAQIKNFEYNEIIEGKDLEIRNLRRQLFDVEDKLRKFQKYTESLENETTRLKQRLGEKEEVILRPLELHAEALQEELTFLKSKLEALSIELSEKNIIINNFTERNDSLSNQLAGLQQERDEIKSQLQEAQDLLKQHEQDYQNSTVKIEESFHKQLTALQQQLVQSEQGARHKIEEKEKKIIELNKMVELKADEHRMAEKNLKKEVEQFRKDNQVLKAKLSRSEEEKVDIKSKLSDLRQQFVQLKNSIPEKISESQRTLKEKNNELKEALEESKKSLQEEMAENETAFKEKIAGLEDTLHEKERRIKELSKVNENLLGQIDVSKRLTDKLDQEIANLKNRLNQTEASISGQIIQAKRPLEEKVALLTQQLNDVHEASELKRNKLETLYKNKLANQEEQIKTLEIDSNQKQTDIYRLEKEKAGLKDQILKKDEKIEYLTQSYQPTLESKENKIAELNKENDLLHSKTAHLENENNELKSQLQDANRLVAEKEVTLEDFLKNQIDLGEEIKKLKEELSQRPKVSPAEIEAAQVPLMEEINALKAKLELTKSALDEEKAVSRDLRKVNTANLSKYSELERSIPGKISSARAPLLEQIQALKKRAAELENQLRVVWDSTQKILDDFKKQRASNEAGEEITAVEETVGPTVELGEAEF